MASANIDAVYPLNAVQDGVLYHTLYAPESSLYMQQYTAVLEGPLDVPAFRAAWDVAIGRHEALRSLITWDEREQPLQVVRTRIEPAWRIEDWSTDDAERQARRLREFLAADRKAGFVLDVAPLMRFALLRLGDEVHRFVWTHHHIVLDGWSLGLVLDEVFRVYEAPDTRLPDSVPLGTYVAWYRSQDWTSGRDHWEAVVAPIESATTLGIERETGSPWAERQVATTRTLGPALSQRVDALSRTAGVTAGTIYRGAWALLLSTYSDERRVAFGTAVAGRPPELEGSLQLVGMFINSVPVRIDLDPTESVIRWLRSIQADHAAGSAHEATPLSRIQEWSSLPSDEPLFRSLLVFENVPEAGAATGRLQIRDVEYLQESNYPLSVLVMPGPDHAIHLLYDPDRYTPADMERLLDHLVATISGLTEEPGRSLGAVPGLTQEALQQLLVDRNQTDEVLDGPATIHELVLRHVERIPDAPAVIGAEATLTYAELGQRSGSIANHLISRGVGPGSLVVISMARSPGMVAAMLGVLRAGAGYVPVDPAQPADRVRFLLADTAAALLITDEEKGTDALVVGADGAVVSRPGSGEGRAAAPSRSAGADDIAYVMYTSGSTGRPKGVMVTHANLVSSTLARRVVYGGPPSAFLVVSPLFFDSSVAGIYGALAEGGAVVLPGPDMEQDVVHLASLIADERVTHALMLPSLYGLLLEHNDARLLEGLDTVMVAGEPCARSLVQRHHQTLPRTRLFNEYGPTEATVWCTVAQLDSSDDSLTVPIGRPIPNCRVFVLDALGRPSPDGAIGELWVSGPGVATGYLGSSELTAERFVDLDLPVVGSVRAYRTGDLVRYRSDGQLELAGRRDHQVKIRGQRIELEEIESVLRGHPEVADAVAVTDVDATGRPTGIVAFVEPADVDADDVHGHASALLPRVMVPSTVVPRQLPRRASGKVDRHQLSAHAVIEVSVGSGTGPTAPASPTEQTLAEIWSSVLGVENVGIHDNFFDLGGDSILTIRIIARAHAAGLSMTPRQFFDNPTISELAALLDS